jgi:putative ATPase
MELSLQVHNSKLTKESPCPMSEFPLFNSLEIHHRKPPLAEVLRPKTLTDFMGQEGIVGPNTPLFSLLQNKQLTSLILWGPPGVGKTTLARIVATQSSAAFIQLSAVNSGVKELREAMTQAEQTLKMQGLPTVIFVDEIHRYSKTQQDGILPYVENGTITLIGATTENPSFQVTSALLSRVLVVKLSPLSREHVQRVLERGIQYLGNVLISREAIGFLVDYANGDARSALNLLETASKCAPPHPEKPEKRALTTGLLEQLAQQNRLNYDRQGDEHYDHASAYQKSMRGGDADAALYWLGKMIAAGEDPRFIARRLVVTAAEDVGLADPMALGIANDAAQAVERLGLPEGRIPLAMATIYVAKAKKSNQAIVAIDAVLNDIQRHGKSYPVPLHLRDNHYAGAKEYGHGVGYVYTHSQPEQVQTFLPDELWGRVYLEP